MTKILPVSFKYREDNEGLWAELRLGFREGSGTSFILSHFHCVAGPKQPEPSKLLEGGQADIVGHFDPQYTLEQFRKYERMMREALRSKETLLAYLEKTQGEGSPTGILRKVKEADIAFQPSAIAARPLNGC